MEPRQPYFDIIDRHLRARGTKADDFKYDTHHKQMNWLVRMAEELTHTIRARGQNVTIADVIRAERPAAGHVDYHTKAALYMDEMARGVHWIIQEAVR